MAVEFIIVKDLNRYWQASRPYAYPAAIVPVLLGTALAKLIFPLSSIHWFDFILVMIGCIGAQGVSNLVNDLVDFKTGIDNPESAGRTSFLVAGKITPKEMRNVTIVVGALCTLIGAYFTFKIGLPMFWLGLVGGILAIEYTAPPLQLKYRALGDLTVFICFGLGMVYGAYLVQSYQQPSWSSPRSLLTVFAYSTPSASLVVAILHANNHRDREKDAQLDGRTVANLLSFKLSKIHLFSLLISPYVFAVLAVILRWTSPYTLLVLLTIPILLKVLGPISKDDFRMIVPNVAGLHGKFGALMTLGVLGQVISAVFHPLGK